MSTVLIQITDHEFQDIIAEAYAKGAEMAKKHFEEKNSDQDIISEEEVMIILDCGYSKLSKLRSNKKIKYYTHSRPYSYSKKSAEAYRESTAS